MTPSLEPTIHMWVTFGFIVITIFLYIRDRLSIELASVLCLGTMIAVFHLMPLPDAAGRNRLDAQHLLAGFANPALITVLALVIVGQGLAATGALNGIAGEVKRRLGGRPGLAVPLTLAGVGVIAAFLNNTPVVVIFIPVLQALADHNGQGASKVMMPLSFACILGGMTTLIGSSTNLLVSQTLPELGLAPLSFFEVTPLGLLLAAVGLVYVLFIAPLFLPDQQVEEPGFSASAGRQFLSHLTVQADSLLVGVVPVAGHFRELPDVTVLMIWRQRKALLPPFEALAVQPRDILVIAATREVLTNARMHEAGLIPSDLELGVEANQGTPFASSHRQVAEAIVTPDGGLAGRTIRDSRFLQRYGCLVMGLQRRSRMIRSRMTEIPLQAGDILLLYGIHDAITGLYGNRDLMVLQQSARDMPNFHGAGKALAIFLTVVLLAATDLLPIVISALLGAGLMVLTGAIRLDAALRGIDFKLVFIVGTSLALGTALEQSGGATYLADRLIMDVMADASPAALLSVFFLIVAVFTNLISNNACAVLFTPVAVHLAYATGIDPHVFAIATLFAANCSFCSPIGYQTNLLVMGPGRYRFADFVKVGTPLALLVWLTFSIAAPVYYGL